VAPRPNQSVKDDVSVGAPAHRARLPESEERALVIAAQAGDPRARERVVEAFLPSIGGMARRYTGSSAVTREELVQEGVVGVLRAVDRFDASMGTPFWAYASWWVRQAMQQLVAEVTGPVVLSDRALRRLARLKEVRRSYGREHGREPTTAELVEETGFTPAQIDSLLATERTPRGLEEPVGGEDGVAATVGELVADEGAEDEYDRVLERMEIRELRDLSEDLAERERNILYAHYGLGREPSTLREIAEGLDLSVERVRQIEERALGKLREAAAAPPAPKLA
jgi:RNA polymerase primary sigma factor